MAALAERIGEVSALLSDIALDLGKELLDIPDPEELEELLERQQELRQLRRFAVDVDGAIAWRDEAREKLATLDVSDDALAELAKQVSEKEAAIKVGRKLSGA